MHSGIVSHQHHHSGVYACVGHGIERVCRHVQSNVLLCAKASASGKARTEGCLHGYLLIGCPLAINLIILCSFLRNLRAGSTGIAGYKAYARLIESPGNSLIAKHELSVFVSHKEPPNYILIYIFNPLNR